MSKSKLAETKTPDFCELLGQTSQTYRAPKQDALPQWMIEDMRAELGDILDEVNGE